MMDVMQCHPCFSEQAHREVGRVHLPVAPTCNIQCNFCSHRICANLTMQHPGWAQQVLSVEDAVSLVVRLTESHPGDNFVVGVAGPGEPLANPETFEALSRVHQNHPGLLKCVSTNGLLLEEKLEQLLAVGVRALTVTVNAVDNEVGGQIYAWVRYQDTLYKGEQAAEVLLNRQLRGIRAALNCGMAVKVNTVLIPGVNDRQVGMLAINLSELGVRLMNLMPLIPGGKMADRAAPSCVELRNARAECEAVLPQFRLCEHCRADVIKFPRRREAEAQLG
jgi:nitrogen fixation protein NifB